MVEVPNVRFGNIANHLNGAGLDPCAHKRWLLQCRTCRLGFSLCRSDNVSNRDLYNRDMMNPDSQKEGGQHGLDRVELVDAVDLVS